MTRWVAALVGFAAAWPLTVGLRAFALKRGVLDQPNSRSSHAVATPRGGGMSFVVVTVVGAAVVAAITGGDAVRVAAALAVGGLPVAVVGLLDDVRSLPAALRGAVHAAASAGVLAVLGLPARWTGSARVLLPVLCVLALVWLVNLFNFMDGIDGLAAGQALVAAAGLAWLSGGGTVSTVALMFSGAVAGFLVLNWPPASIFMGDVGSGFLGMALGVLGLAAHTRPGLPLLLCLLLVGPFLVDATGTLLLRVVDGERWYAPHRGHLYQRLVAPMGGHRPVMLAYTGLAAGLAVEGRLVLHRAHSDVVAAVTTVVLTVGWAATRRQLARTRPPLPDA